MANGIAIKKLESELNVLLHEKNEFEPILNEIQEKLKEIDSNITEINKKIELEKKDEQEVKPSKGIVKVFYPTEDSVIAIYDQDRRTLKLIALEKSVNLQKRYKEFFKTYNLNLEIKGEFNTKTKERAFCSYVIKDGEKIMFEKNELEIKL